MRKFTVKSAQELSPSQKEKLEQALLAGVDEDAEIEYIIENIIGGLVINYGDKIIDASLGSELKELHKEISNLAQSCKGNAEKFTPSRMAEKLKEHITGKHSRRMQELPITSCGQVVASADGVIKIQGLSSCKYGELLKIGADTYALAMNLEADAVGAILLSDAQAVQYGDIAYSTGSIVEVPVGGPLYGRVVDALGQPLDGAPLYTLEKRRIESPAPSVFERDKVREPLSTGILAIDSMIPIGKGQRELIIGDRQTGKTTIALDTILNQKGKDVYCVYVAIGQRAGTIIKIIDKLEEKGAFAYTTIVAATADQSAPLQYLAPYTGCAIAEYEMNKGKDVLIVYDDLTKHAAAYRAISLLLKRPAGREAYPGDIFYIHSRLLERAAKLSKEMGGGSLTALPIVETQAGDISSYIPTNIISITDGQIYLETELFNANIRPAVNVGLSVSRVGGSAQPHAIRQLSSKLRLELAQYRELKLFSQFGSDVDRATQMVLNRGERALQALIQPEGAPMDTLKEIVYLFAIGSEALEKVPLILIDQFLMGFYSYYKSAFVKEAKELAKNGVLTAQLEESLAKAMRRYFDFFEAEAR